MDTLFKTLPRDLQWEILSEFVGTHVVRKGKLMRKIVYITIDGIIMRQLGNNHFLPVINGLRVRERLPWLYDRNDNLRHYIRFRVDTQMKFCEDVVTGDTIYCYRKVIDDLPLWKLYFTALKVKDVIILPPFVKNVYPSYEFTNKKRKFPLIR